MRTIRAISAFACIALFALTPAAYASPPDPTWLSGVYDNADFDDVVLFITGNMAAVEPSEAESIRPWAMVVDLVAEADTARPTASLVSSDQTRAPPLV